jgi:L-2-hydroxyglutarate oxidase LhgO
MADWDAVIVGAGAVGLAAGRALAARGRSVVVLERHERFGEETSARNSEVIHAGLYYPPGSLKARLCVAGRRALYQYCAARRIEARAIGKLIVAVDDSELPALRDLLDRGAKNEVEGLTLIEGAAARAMEPQLTCVAAIHSAQSGVFDSHGFMLALLGEIEDAGGALARAAPFEGASPHADGWQVRIGGAGASAFTTRLLILCPGLGASEAAAKVEGLAAEAIPETRYAKGVYFRYAGPMPFARLIYPAPSVAGHGVHYTPMADGRGRFGPDFEMVDAIDYQVDPARAAAFAEGIARYWPTVSADRLVADYAGVRPKIGAAPARFEDFRIDGPGAHGLAGLFCFYGIDSPGLTSSFALGEHLADLTEKI